LEGGRKGRVLFSIYMTGNRGRTKEKKIGKNAVKPGKGVLTQRDGRMPPLP